MGTFDLNAFSAFQQQSVQSTAVGASQRANPQPSAAPRAQQVSQGMPALANMADTFAFIGEAAQITAATSATYQPGTPSALAPQFQSVAGTGPNPPVASTSGEQMLFEFSFEMRVEQLQVFQQRTGAVASGLNGSQQQQFTQASQSMSVSFSMSMSVSATALNGFAGGAEAMQAQGGDAMERFTNFATDMMARADEVVNEIFTLMDDVTSGAGGLGERFDQFLEALNQAGLFTIPGFDAPDAPLFAAETAGSMNVQLVFEFASVGVQSTTTTASAEGGAGRQVDDLLTVLKDMRKGAHSASKLLEKMLRTSQGRVAQLLSQPESAQPAAPEPSLPEPPQVDIGALLGVAGNDGGTTPGTGPEGQPGIEALIATA